jgi:hypothetical protein
MAQPVPYVITRDFSDDEAGGVAGRSTVSTPGLDGEFSNIATTLAQILANLAILQRDDTKLNDGMVELHTLSSAVRALFATASSTPRGDWVTATAYSIGDLVSQGTGTYICAQAHTSGVFATDLAADKWLELFNTASYVASGVAFTPTGTIAASTVQAAIAEAAAEALQKASNLSDLQSFATAIVNLISGATEETAPAVDDLVALYDFSAGGTGGRKMTLANLLKVLNALTEDADPDAAADFALVYDASAGAVKKVKLANIARYTPQSSKSADYTLVLADAGTDILHPSSDNNPRTFTIPANAVVAFPVGAQINFINKINTVTIAINTDTLTLAGAGTTGSRTLAANGMATIKKIGTTEWMITGAGLT